jgi:two-component system NtrC family sensor kinase
MMKGGELQPETRCLTLLATASEKPEWNSRNKSEGHKTIPLPSEQVFQAIPMVSQLVKPLGIDIGTVLRPDPSLVLEMEQKTYNVFFVQEAAGSPFIPAQENFVIPYKVRSVLGFGGLLPSGDIYVVLLFARVSISRDSADIFRNAAMNLKVALLPFLERPVFVIPNYEQQ